MSAVKYNARWQHVSRLKASAFCSSRKKADVDKTHQLIPGMSTAILEVVEPHCSHHRRSHDIQRRNNEDESKQISRQVNPRHSNECHCAECHFDGTNNHSVGYHFAEFHFDIVSFFGCHFGDCHSFECHFCEGLSTECHSNQWY